MAFKDLPPKYYLSHFFELIDFLQDHYGPLFESEHEAFLKDFRSLSEDAQCLYVRMINRKGVVFNVEAFNKYGEIENLSEALEQLRKYGLISSLTSQDKRFILQFLVKADLRQWLLDANVHAPSSFSRENLIELAHHHLDQLDLDKINNLSDLIVQRRAEDLDYLLFLYFGKIQKTLNLYTLRDLGIRKTNEKNKFRPRFKNKLEAKTEYFFSKKLEEPGDPLELIEHCQNYTDINASARKLKDQLLLYVAEQAEDIGLKVSALKECRSHPARERLVRLLYKNGQKIEARELLDQIIQDPWSDEELLFAEDFILRKFDGKKLGHLTEILNNSQELTLSDFYFRKPEQGVRDFYREKGFEVHFTENYLWTGLFGILFWSELFESDQAAIFNPFERGPIDLVGPDFYHSHQESLENKLRLLQDPKKLEFYILKTVSANYGKLNDVFQWHPNLVHMVLGFLKSSVHKNVALVLRTMAQRFEYYHSGYPDLMIIEESGPSFIEVKAEGDALRSKQLSKIRLLREAGFKVDVLKVKWESDPNQVYVVVDVETTGGSSLYHRVTEIGAVKIQGGEVIDEFETLINPGRSIPRNITQITGITDEMVADAPYFSEIADKFLEFTDRAIFVAHNARFDYGFIQREFQRLNVEFVRPTMCTVSGMRKAFPGLDSYSLKNLTEHFSISLESHHRALCDAKAASALLLMMNEARI